MLYIPENYVETNYMVSTQEKLDVFKDGSSDVVISVLKDKALIALQGEVIFGGCEIKRMGTLLHCI